VLPGNFSTDRLPFEAAPILKKDKLTKTSISMDKQVSTLKNQGINSNSEMLQIVTTNKVKSFYDSIKKNHSAM